MKDLNTQSARLAFLVEAFKADSDGYQKIETPADEDDKRRLLRALMNIRMPKELPAEVLEVQDAYLQERAREKGIVPLEDVRTVDSALNSSHPFADVFAVWQGDITRLAVDAIVNAANSQMLGCFVPLHTCIDNTIHTFAGVQLRAECDRQMQSLRARYGMGYEQPTGVPMLTEGYNLPAEKVIHVTGPIVERSLTPELEQDLANCYRNSLDLCRDNELRSIAFCCISTGLFRFPNDRAAEIAVNTCTEWLKDNPDQMDRIIFNVFKDSDKRIYEGQFK